MDFFNPTYYTKVYRDFKAIESTAFREIIRFYEKEEDKILRLDFDEFFECLVAYVDALFEIGAYRKHLLLVDVVIEKSITNNITLHKGQQVFHKMLFRKAASLYNTNELEKATYVLSELLKMEPDDEMVSRFYQKCRLKARPKLLNHARATSVFLLLLSALLISLEVLFVRPFYDIHILLVVQVRTILFVLGILSMLGGFGLNYYLAFRDTANFVESIRKKRNTKA